MIGGAQAGLPVWEFTQDDSFPSKTFVSATGTAIVKYTVDYPNWPTGTTVDTSSPSACANVSTLDAGAACTITIDPGSTATPGAGNVACTTGIPPISGVVTASASNANSTMSNVVILSYGCIYQGGFVFSVDDTQGCSSTPCTGSVGGKTAAVADTLSAPTLPQLTTPNWGGYGTDIGPNLWSNSTQGANDGSVNSAAIISALTTNFSAPPYNGMSPVDASDYAAGLCSTLSVDASGDSPCTAPNTCYIDWYLPAICELGPFGVICTDGSSTIQQQLFENTLIPSATLGSVDKGYYWSSTEFSTFAATISLSEFFDSDGLSNQRTNDKSYRLGVRCARALTGS